MFLEPGFPPKPMPVAYVPAQNMNDLIATASLASVEIRPVPGKKGRYELEGDGPKQYVLFQNGYALITPSEMLIDEELPDPVEFNQTLTARYDVAATLRIKSIPPLLVDVFLSFFRSQTEAELQRRDGEPEGAYKIRRANGISTLEGLEQLIKEGDQLTIGIDGNQELHKTVIEFNLQATPDSAFAKVMQESAGRTSFFAPIQKDSDKPFTAAISTLMNPREKKATVEMLEGARLEMNRLLTDQKLDPLSGDGLMDVLVATAEEGHLDAFVQIAVPKPGQYVVTGALKLKGADAAAASISRLATDVTSLGGVKSFDLNQETHQGVSFHRIMPEGDDDGAKRFFGAMPAFWFGAGQRAFWFTAGADDAIPTLKDTMDRVLGASPAPEGSTAPFILVFRRAKFFAMEPPEGAQSRRELAETAFNSQNDKLLVETRPTENGMRMRAELDEGFVRWLGLMIARQFDQSQL
jgi:hypothetical protein